MTRTAMLGAAAFGVTGAVAGYLWVALEFPFAVLLPALLGWYVVARRHNPTRTAVAAALVGGVSFTGVLLVGMYLAITDGSPLPIPGSLAALAAAAVAGALTGWVLGRARGAVATAGFTAAGMALAVAAALVLRQLSPAATDTPGLAQGAWAALSLGVVGAIVGAAAGAAVAWVARGGDAA